MGDGQQGIGWWKEIGEREREEGKSIGFTQGREAGWKNICESFDYGTSRVRAKRGANASQASGVELCDISYDTHPFGNKRPQRRKRRDRVACALAVVMDA